MTTIINGSSPSLTFSDSTTQTTAFTTGAVTQATIGTNVVGTGPSFSAYQSTQQTLASGTFTKLLFQTELWDTNSNYDNVTNSRFTPTVAGYYQINSAMAVAVSVTQIQVTIYKNGTIYKQSSNLTGAGQTSVSGLVYMNGTTDYVEIYASLAAGQGIVNIQAYTWFDGSLVRAA